MWRDSEVCGGTVRCVCGRDSEVFGGTVRGQ